MSGASLVITVVLGVLAVGLVVVERGVPDPRRIAVIAALAAAATAGRLLFVAIPSVKPVTVIVLVTGAVLGAHRPVSSVCRPMVAAPDPGARASSVRAPDSRSGRSPRCCRTWPSVRERGPPGR